MKIIWENEQLLDKNVKKLKINSISVSKSIGGTYELYTLLTYTLRHFEISMFLS